MLVEIELSSVLVQFLEKYFFIFYFKLGSPKKKQVQTYIDIHFHPYMYVNYLLFYFVCGGVGLIVFC